jgi:hypothetical protein
MAYWNHLFVIALFIENNLYSDIVGLLCLISDTGVDGMAQPADENKIILLVRFMEARCDP